MAKLPTYDDACEQLGGRPWLEKPEATDRWFLADATSLLTATPSGGVAALVELTGSFDLKKRMSLSTKLALLAIAVLGAIVVIVVNL